MSIMIRVCTIFIIYFINILIKWTINSFISIQVKNKHKIWDSNTKINKMKKKMIKY